jgi:hypothetical protein
MDLIGFNNAVAATEHDRRHVLLGNGFSIGLDEDFGYPNLYRYVIQKAPDFVKFFPDPNRPNFEEALRAVSDPADKIRIRNALIRAVAAVHPQHSLSLSDGECISARNFLEHFIGRRRQQIGSVFTTNYDLLLHWVMSRQGKTKGTKQKTQLKAFDGFENNGEWRDGADAQVYYLHGAVHIYERPYNSRREKFYTEMLRYEDVRIPLKQQVALLLANGDLPVFVAAGTAEEKRSLQRGGRDGRGYLKSARRKFEQVCGDQRNVLFTFGHSFGASDDHITEAIGQGRVGTVFIGVFSDNDKSRALELEERWSEARRATGASICVKTYDAAECNVWGQRRPTIRAA